MHLPHNLTVLVQRRVVDQGAHLQPREAICPLHHTFEHRRVNGSCSLLVRSILNEPIQSRTDLVAVLHRQHLRNRGKDGFPGGRKHVARARRIGRHDCGDAHRDDLLVQREGWCRESLLERSTAEHAVLSGNFPDSTCEHVLRWGVVLGGSAQLIHVIRLVFLHARPQTNHLNYLHCERHKFLIGNLAIVILIRLGKKEVHIRVAETQLGGLHERCKLVE
mmetsp:Transcript_73232/g.162612  ORF Transcript_73232/g.162612 Transcript_73232/m.162612 type:complete len:220 (-) Transcript_73232:459-1118(-)